MATDKQPSMAWLLAGGLVVAALMFAVVAKFALAPEDVKPQPARVRESGPPPTPARADEPTPTPREPLAARAPEAQRPEPAEEAPAGPACTRDEDCRGPKSAECVVASCQGGHCAFDRSSCECALDAECDDGIECTRDLCFGATKKCIHMRSGCD